MSEATPPQPPQSDGPQSGTLRFARFITRNRFPVALFLIFSSLFFFYPIFNTAMGAAGVGLPGPKVRINTDARSLFPDHPYVHAQDKFAKTFGSSSLVAIAVVVVNKPRWWRNASQIAAEVLKRIFCEKGHCRPEAADRFRTTVALDDTPPPRAPQLAVPAE